MGEEEWVIIRGLISFYEKTGRYWIIPILVIALWIRLDFVLHYVFPAVNFDQLNYTNMTVQLLDKGIYGYMSDIANSRVTPGFPIFMAIIFKVFGYGDIDRILQIVRIIQCFVAIIGIWYIYRIGARLFSRMTGLLAAVFASLYAPFVFITGLILTETLFLAFFLAAIYYQVRIIQENKLRDHIIAGVLIGVSVLIRPNSALAAVIPYVFLWAQHRKLFLRQILFAIGAFVVVMLPWWVRNAITFHAFIPIAQNASGNAFLAGTNPYGMYPVDWNKVKETSQSQEGWRRIKEGVQDAPLIWLKWFTMGKFSTMFIETFYGGFYSAYIDPVYGRFLHRFHKILIYAGFFFALTGGAVKRKVLFLSAHLFVLLAVQLMFIPESRYTIPMFPFLMLLTAWGLLFAASLIFGRFLHKGSQVRAIGDR
ncbi:ArnT family glycosyltransferase [Gorillibacterium massiliense]|uniref:ArnT family glycosyltransferase n=1 Tax=Gorillibacterium massiliense TaxID=1280390 RepID=UPI0004B3219C|nr:glycosyltransferase family 39 protein [Gorillibacterium massiliense]